MSFIFKKKKRNNDIATGVEKNDGKATWLIAIFSVVVFAAVVLLSRIKLHITVGFDVHIFATINAIINSVIAMLFTCSIICCKK